METVRRSLPDRGGGLERGCRFMITANLLDDMRVHLLFNRLGRDTQRILDRERRAGAMSDDANAVDAEKRTAAIVFVFVLSLMLRNDFRARSAPSFRIGVRASSCLSHAKIATEIDSHVFKITLPTKPSHTTTSTGSSKRCRPSILPTKLSELLFSILKTSFVISLPFTSSSPREIRPTFGLL